MINVTTNSKVSYGGLPAQEDACVAYSVHAAGKKVNNLLSCCHEILVADIVRQKLAIGEGNHTATEGPGKG